MGKLNAKSLLDVQVALPEDIEGLENQDDLISTNLLMATVYASGLLPILGRQALGQIKVSKKEVFDATVKILTHVLMLCKACNFDIPELEELEEFEEGMPSVIRFDAVITVFSIIGALSNTAHVISVDLDQPIWAEENVPEEFEDDMITIVIGLKNLGAKYGFTMDDVLAELY